MDANTPTLGQDSGAHGMPHSVTAFTSALTAVCLEHGVAIDGGRVVQMDMTWSGPDAEKWEQYAVDSDGALVRGFWNQDPTVNER
jgi:hypothetical protein